MGADSGNHPMVPVPEAIRTVMEETARVLLEYPKNPVEMSTSSEYSTLLNCVLAEDVIMPEPGYPDYNASIMDGYAIRVEEFKASDNSETWTHHIISKVYAGDKAAETAEDQDAANLPSAIYITTGARVPDSYNCVVPIEECTVSDDSKSLNIAPSASIKDMQWIRPKGCDIPANSIVLPEGHIIDPIAIGLLKQANCKSIKVKRKVKVGVLSTGNELIVDGNVDQAGTGKIPDVNRPILLSLLSTLDCCEPIDLGLVRDDSVEDIAKTLQQGVEKCDVIITSGGVSMGETDLMEEALINKCGGILHFGRMHMKPGKPTTFVTVPSSSNRTPTLVFAMPGNPVSATVCTQLLVKPCLEFLLQGIDNNILEQKGSVDEKHLLKEVVEDAFVHPELRAKLAHDIVLDKKRPEYHRVTIQQMNDGSFHVTSTGVQRSSRLMSLRDAEGLLVLPHAVGDKIKALAGETYSVLLLNNPNKFGKAPVRIKDSIHLRKPPKPMKVAVIEVIPEGRNDLSKLDETCRQVEVAISGSESGAATVSSKIMFDGAPDKLYPLVVDACNEGAGLIVVCCASFDGSLRHSLAISNTLKQSVTKPAKALAMQARQGAASQNPKLALFEVVVGYVAEGDGAMLIGLPEGGLLGALSNVRGLLKHGLDLARGKSHSHHH